MAERFINKKGFCFFGITEAETMALSARFPLDFLHFFNVSQTKTRKFNPNSPEDLQQIQRFEGLCELLNFPLSPSPKSKCR